MPKPPKYDAEIEALRANMEYAPREPGNIQKDLRGWKVGPSQHFICASCAGRLIGRGCSIPRPASAVWEGEKVPQCVLSDFHAKPLPEVSA